MKTITINEKKFEHESPYNLFVLCIAYLISEINKSSNKPVRELIKSQNGRAITAPHPKDRYGIDDPTTAQRPKWILKNKRKAKLMLYKAMGTKLYSFGDLITIIEDTFKVRYLVAQGMLEDYSNLKRRWKFFKQDSNGMYMINVKITI